MVGGMAFWGDLYTIYLRLLQHYILVHLLSIKGVEGIHSKPMPKYNQTVPEQARAAAFNSQHKAYNSNTTSASQTTAGKTQTSTGKTGK
jgi:hypothetical protein